MLFSLSKLFWMLARPSMLLVLTGVVGLVLSWWQQARGRRGRLGLWLMTVSLGGFALIIGLSLNQIVLRPLEDRFPQVTDPPAEVAGIIVLGGAVEPLLSEQRGIPALNDAAERMTTFVALARRYPQARLVFTGGRATIFGTGVGEAVVAHSLFDSLGLADRGVVYEDRSRNTVENATDTRDLMHPQPGELWILVTSASHMPRSVGVFRKAGWNVLPWPVGYKTGGSGATLHSGRIGDRLEQLDWATHEWVGLLAYWLLGRTDTLFPGPGPTRVGAALAQGSDSN